MLFKIGDFSKKTGISIRTLRYYDQMDLFKPQEIDLFTNYRYYNEEQIEDLELIIMLKEAGFSLEEIKNSWNNFNEDIMLKKKSRLFKEIGDVREKIKKVDYLRSNISKGKIIFKVSSNDETQKKKSLFK